MNAVTWVFEDRDRATGVLLVAIALLVLAGHYAQVWLSFRKDARDQDLEAVAVSTDVMVTRSTAAQVPMQRVTNGEDLLGGGLR